MNILLPAIATGRRWMVFPLFTILLAGLPGLGCNAGSAPPQNRLSGEISPYLRSHARNPVDWYPWGAEAIGRARLEDKPIFLSVGYSTCYWCHVMEREVFSDPDIAAVMNARFVNVKVDREERPDIDEIYMTATQLITGGGGWPNSVFLTPELEPFFAGTYFPPEDLPGRPGFPRILNLLSEAWRSRPEDLVDQAGRVAGAIRAIQSDLGAGTGSTPVDDDIVTGAITHMKTRYDAENGGFGPAPKFPPPMRLELALHEYGRTGDAALLSMAIHTLDVVMNGGMYDHVGGGFHRYATDSSWRIPHFEKMLYNQADLARVYLLAYELTGRKAYRAVAENVLAFVEEEMTGPLGAFYSAVDSETEAVEGRFYRWTGEEIRKTLGADTDNFLTFYGIQPLTGAAPGDASEPAGEETDAGAVLYVRSRPESATSIGRLDEMLGKLERVRSARKHPMVDTKVITAWNGQMIDTFAYAGRVTGNGKYLDLAAKAADHVLEHMRDDSGALRRIYLDGETRRDAFQEDYAYLARGLLRLFEATGDGNWLTGAESLVIRMNERFLDNVNGGYFFTSEAEDLIVRTRNPYDGARASGNAMAAHALLSLARHTGDTRYGGAASRLFQAYAASMKEHPGRFSSMILALRDHLYGETAVGPHAAFRTGLDASARGFKGRTLADDSRSDADAPAVQPSASFGGPPKVDADLAVVAENTDAFKATVSVTVADGWHINANPASMAGLVSTAVTFNADVPVRIADQTYPRGETMRFSFAGEPLEVYRGKIALRARIEVDARTLKDGARLYGTLYYQACNDEVCLEPDEITMSAPFD